jgi:putative DNA primase/helicase
MDANVLSNAVARLAAAALLAHSWPKSDRHEVRMALGGTLARAGWSQESTIAFVQSILQVAQPDDAEAHSKVAGDTRSAYVKLQRGEPITGLPRLAELCGIDVARCFRDWLSFEPKNVSTNVMAEWQEPSPLGDELLSVPAFDVACLPANCRSLVEDVSERMQTPPDYAAAALVVALAGCVGRRASIQPKSLDTSWLVVPNLWGSIIGPPGLMKSPVVQAVTRPLAHIEQLWRELYGHDCEDYEREKELLNLKHQAWKDQTKSDFKKGVPPKSAPDSTLEPPTQKRLLLTDSTPEKLHEILSVNLGGVLVLRDELTGWLAELDRHGREGERAFYLQAWNGDSGFTIDRIGRGSIHVPAACVSLFGNIQPSRLRTYLADAVSAGPGDDGLFQRFQVTVWPDTPRKWSLVDRAPNSFALTTAERVFSVLANLSPDTPIRATFDPDAQELFFGWWAALEDEVRSESGLHPAMVAHLSKYRSLMPSLALLFELSDVAVSGLMPGEGLTVGLDHALQAVALCKYLEGHARRVYACIISPETRAARELARHIRAHDLPSTFATRAVYLKGWSGLDSPERVRGALTVLEDADWVRRIQPFALPSGGRPSEMWTVNPRVARHA